ncbi:MAG: PTS galactitol transporter subunit IIC [Bacillaceae bacterium]|jgi:Phosphotransferase system, galactitol-specific IIC component|uniref:PTS transporter subunit IIC n=1 Tax=Aeribacillus composti TaxID=1868734 RepID=A0ABY9WFN9_9BACI|nr:MULTISPECIES: PTS transporter subunit IIC [Aeribacillus]REJ18368.1 MAG: PTS galactitol transporter subunit IIC [Bacillaceae bacterium]KZM57633.1 PTS galactitol transporter subunit IIC [Aeribacillus pallidus]MED0651808.1 PTS transporter subunit IIC [Aeribacillus composti]MED0702928.1 PTS transporter subunit IIC [Aeribacillus composti]MED0716526.1 PTS transporter subunit IIC [Aeribacillus composti]
MIKQAVDFILDLGPSIMLPIIMTIFGLILKQGFKKSFRAALTIGIGFVGVNLVITLLTNSLGPATEAMVKKLGLELGILDVGWPIGAAISFGTPVAPLMIPLVLILNVILLSINFTKTLNVDIWNFWHLIFAASVTYYAYDNMILALFVGLVVSAITLKLADWTAPAVEHHFGLKGVSLAHSETVNFAPITYATNRILDKIPGINKIHADPETLSKRFGIFGEPLMMGLILGMLISILGGYDLKGILTLGVQMAAVLVLLPRMVSLLMEGLIPISEGARDYINKKFPGKNVYIGLDAAIVIGNPANMAVALIMVPITILLAVILPYNQMLPFTDLAVLPFTVIWAVAAARGNIVRGLINAIITIMIVLFIATNLAELATTMGRAVGFDFPEGASLISGIDLGSHVIPWIIVRLLDPTNPYFIAAIICAVLYGLIWYWVRNDIKKQFAKEMGILEENNKNIE